MEKNKKNSFIISYNVNAHRPVDKTIPFVKKLTYTAKNIRATYGLPLIIMFQEMLAGRNIKFLDLLRGLYPEYELILPAGFDYVSHYKSIMSITLIRRDVLGNYKVIDLDSELCNRTCYILAELNGRKKEFFIINSHIAQVQNFRHQADWYIAERRRLHDLQWNFLHDELHKNKDVNVIFAGDMQESKSSSNLIKLMEDGYIVPGIKTVRNGFFDQESCIDHIVLSSEARSAFGKETELIYDNKGLGIYSDHTLLCLCS